MALALLANVLPRVIAILNAHPGAFSATVSSGIGAWPSDAEINAAVLEADGLLLTQGYFQSVNNTLSQPFMAPSAPVERGGDVPFHYGNTGRVEVSNVIKGFVDADVNTTTETITIANHGLTTGDVISFMSTGALPAPLVANTTYYAVVISSSTFKVASTLVNALAATPVVINLTSAAGGGSHTVISWLLGEKAQSKDDIISAVAVGETYVGSGAFTPLYAIEDGNFFHVAQWGRIEVPSYTRTSVLQANMADETLIIAIAVKILTKNASPAPFEAWAEIAAEGMQAIIRDGSYQPENPPDENP